VYYRDWEKGVSVNQLRWKRFLYQCTAITIHESGLGRLAISSLAVVFLCSCGLWPESGDIVTVEVPGGSDLAYGIVGDPGRKETSKPLLVIALPTGFEKRRDVVRDIDHIWAPQAKARGWVFVCPASSQGVPFDASKTSGFGLGAERLIPFLLGDLEKRDLLNENGSILVDLWGSGKGVISVLKTAPGVFRHVVLAPSSGVDLDLIRNYDASSGPDMTIVLGEGGHKKIDGWISRRTGEPGRIQLLRIPVKPPHRTNSRDRSMSEIGADYANHICDFINENFNSVLPGP